MNRNIFRATIFVFAFIISACGGLPTATETPTPASASLPICSGAALLAPILISPTNGEVNPVYGQEVITDIQYPDATCIPESFEKFVSIDPAFGGTNYIINPGPVNVPADLGEFWGSGQLTVPLDDCTQYFWKARAIVGASEGPFSGIHTFFTNYSGTCEVPATVKTVCDPADLVAPTIVSPENNAVNPPYGSEVITQVMYPDANCTPEYFEKYVTTDPSFAGPNMIINPGPINIFGENFGSGQITVPLADCTQYYMQARAVAGGMHGPFSSSITFFTDFNGTCELPDAFSPTPYVVALKDANCREGDTTAHRNIGTLFKDQQAFVMAVNPAVTHVLIEEPSTKVRCWVWLDLADLFLRNQILDPDELLDLVDVFTIPPVPTPTFTPEPLDEAVPEATEVTVPICADGIDNDGDGYIDYLYDRQCSSQLDNDESK
jgi:hypothetical protein